MPRAGLSPEVVVSQAAAIADEQGLDALTLSAVADRVGVRPPSLYKHVGGLDDLRDQLAGYGMRALGERLHSAMGARRGRAALQALAGEYRAFVHERPGLYAATVRAPAPDDEALQAAASEATTTLFAVVGGYGIVEPAESVHAARAVRSALHGFVSLEAAGGFGLPESVDESFARLIDLLDAALTDLARRALRPGR